MDFTFLTFSHTLTSRFFTKLGEVTDRESATFWKRSSRHPIGIRINPEIRIRIPYHFDISALAEFTLSECSCSILLFIISVFVVTFVSNSSFDEHLPIKRMNVVDTTVARGLIIVRACCFERYSNQLCSVLVGRTAATMSILVVVAALGEMACPVVVGNVSPIRVLSLITLHQYS